VSFDRVVDLSWYETSSSWSAAVRPSDAMGTVSLRVPGLALTFAAARPGHLVAITVDAAEPASPWTETLIVDPGKMERGARARVALRRDACHLLWSYARLLADETLPRSRAAVQVVYDVERLAVERALAAVGPGLRTEWTTALPPAQELVAAVEKLELDRSDWGTPILPKVMFPLFELVIDVVRHLADPPGDPVIAERDGVRATFAGAQMRVERVGTGADAPGPGRARLVVASSHDKAIGMVLLKAHEDATVGYVVGARPEEPAIEVAPVHPVEAQLDARDDAEEHLFSPLVGDDSLIALARRWVAAGSPGAAAEALRRAGDVSVEPLGAVWLHALAQAVEAPSPKEQRSGLAVPGLGFLWRGHPMAMARSDAAAQGAVDARRPEGGSVRMVRPVAS